MASVLTVIAGPNGSGKSTLTRRLIAAGVDFGAYVNADEIEATLLHVSDAQQRSWEAQKLADAGRSELLAAGATFAFETVLSHPSKVDIMRRARGAGYEVNLVFVAVDDPKLNVARVEQRVALGGHPVPQDRIVARYDRALRLLASAILASDKAVLFDNTFYGNGPTVVGEINRRDEGFHFTLRPNGSVWLRRELLDHLRLGSFASRETSFAIIAEQSLAETARQRIADLQFP